MSRLSTFKSEGRSWGLIGLGLVFALLMANCCPPALTNGQAESDCMRAKGAKKKAAMVQTLQTHSQQTSPAQSK